MTEKVLKVRYTGDTTGVSASRRKIEAENTAMGTKLSSSGSKLSTLLRGQFQSIASGGSLSFSTLATAGLGAYTAIGVGAGILDHVIDKTVELASENRGLSRQFGITVEDASRLRVAGEELGISFDDLSRSGGIFSKHLVDGGTAFEKYGITLTDTTGKQKSFDEILGETADKYVSLQPGIQRTAFLLDVFGRSGKALAPLLAQGSAGIDRMKHSADELGLVMSEKDVAAARALQIQERQLGEALQGIEVSLGRLAIPLVLSFAERLTSLAIAARQAGDGVIYFFTHLGAGIPVIQEAERHTTGLGDTIHRVFGGFIHDIITTFGGALIDTGGNLDLVDDKAKHTASGVDILHAHLDTAAQSVSSFAGMTEAEFTTWEQGTVASLNGVASKLDDLAGRAHLSARGIIRAFDDQLTAMAHYKSNWEALLARGLPDSLATQLQGMGLKGAGIVAALASANQTQFNHIIHDWQRAEGESQSLSGDVGALGHSITNVPSQKKIYFETFGLDAATAGVQSFVGWLDQIHDVSISVAARLYRIEGFAHGGIVGAGVVKVGEAGAELAEFPAGTRIRTAPETRAAAASGGGPGGDVHVHNEFNIAGSVVTERDLVETVREVMVDVARRNGGDLFGGFAPR